MAENNRIVYSSEEIAVSIETALNKLRTFHYDSRFGAIGQSFLESVSAWEEMIRERKEDPFTIVVTGEFKRGKSTFINALLGENTVPMNVAPETVTLNRISSGASKNEAVLPGHKRMLLSNDEITHENLLKIEKETGVKLRSLELKRPNEFLKKVAVIDTPGLNDALDDFADMVEDALLRADMIIYVYDCVNSPLSMSEQLFLKSSIISQKYTKLFLVGNYADVLSNKEDYMRVKSNLEGRVHSLLPDSEIILISALDELCRKLSKPRPNPKMAEMLGVSFDNLRNEIDNLISEKADTVIVDRIERLADAMLEQLSGEIEAMEKGLELERSEAAALVKKLKDNKESEDERLENILCEIDKTAEIMKNNTMEWMMDFLKRIENETDSLSNEKSEEIRKYYSFYCTDMVQEALQECMEYHQEEMFDKLQSISEDSAQHLVGDFLKGEFSHFQMNLDNRIWTSGDTVGMVVSMMPIGGILGTVLNLAGDAVAGMMREKEVNKRVPELVEQIRMGFTKMEASVSEIVGTLYKKLANLAKKIATETIHDDIDKTEHLLSETLKTASMEEEQKQEVKKILNEAKTLLSQCAEILHVTV